MLYIGSDHGGFSLKTDLITALKKTDIKFQDLGTTSTMACDYPIIAQKVALKVQSDKEHRGLLICTSGIGMAITANKFNGIYAAPITSLQGVKQARQHNGINLLCLPGTLEASVAFQLLHVFLTTSIDTAERHIRRRQEILDFESKNFVD